LLDPTGVECETYDNVGYPWSECQDCNLVSSIRDANTIDIWRFNEGVGATSTTGIVGDQEVTLHFNECWSLQPACCGTGLYLGSDNTTSEQILSPNLGDQSLLPDGYTIEFSIFNDGSTSPGLYDYITVFRHDAISYEDGEGIVIIFGFKVNQNLYIVRGTDIEDGTLVVIPLEVNACTAICIQCAVGGSFSVYANGTRVLSIPANANDFWDTYGAVKNEGGFTVFSEVTPYKSALIIDEYRRSNIVRYTGPTYEYTR
jgi:hypothetical protein